MLTLAYSTTTGDAHARTWRPLDEKVAAIIARDPHATVYEIAGLLGDGGVPYRLIEDAIRHATTARPGGNHTGARQADQTAQAA